MTYRKDGARKQQSCDFIGLRERKPFSMDLSSVCDLLSWSLVLLSGGELSTPAKAVLGLVVPVLFGVVLVIEMIF